MRSGTKHVPWTGVALVLLMCLASGSLSAVLAGDGKSADAPKVDLNRATEEELASLPGIGPALATRIVEYRENHGPFRRIEDLMNVRGIGEKSFRKLRDRITVEEKKSRKG